MTTYRSLSTPTRSARTLRTGAGLVLFLLASAAARAQAPAADIDVVDAGGKAIADVEVAVVAADGSVTKTMVTNKKGKWKGTIDVAPGSYRITFSRDGYGPVTIDRELAAGEQITGTITLLDFAVWQASRARDIFNEGVGLLQQAKEDEALAKFEEARTLDAELAPAHGLAAMVLANKGEWDQAKAALTRFLELSPNGLTEIVPVAPAAYRIYRHGGDSAGMTATLEVLRAHGMAQDLAPDSYNEGVLALKEKNFEEAERLFLEALELDPKLAQGHQGLAALHFNQQHYEQALPHAAALLAIFPRSRDGQRMAFFSHFELGHKDQAIASGRAWFELTEAAQDEVLDQAELAFEGNQPEVARRYAEIVLAIDEGAPRAHYLLGRILAGAGDIAGAKRHLQRFIELAPEDGEAAVARAMLEGLG